MRRRRMPCRSSTSGPCSLPPPSTRPASTSRASRWAWVVGLAASLTLLRRVTYTVLPERLAAPLTRIGEGLIAGLEVLKSPARFAAVFAWSLLQWLVNAAAFAVCFRAFGLAVPPEGALLLQGIIGFGVALPASPGFVGVFEAATRVTLAIYGIDATRAVSYALAYHVSTFLPITLLGLYSLSRLRIHLGELREAAATGA